MGIEHVSPDTDINKILEIIERDAAVVIDNVLSTTDLDDIKNELKPYLQNDIAVFKVNETVISRLDFEKWKVYPACLPFGESASKTGFHSGWSSAIPKHILKKYAPGFAKVYREFFKQVHYKMEILDQCEDDNFFTKLIL